MNDDAHEFGGAPLLIGDMNTFGRLYMSAGGGRGVIYWDDINAEPEPEPVTGIHDEDVERFPIYPNPTTSAIIIRNTGNLRRVTLRDEQGRLIHRVPYDGDSATISLKALPAGIYLIELLDNGNTKTVRRVVKK
jgi:hypothetical protein